MAMFKDCPPLIQRHDFDATLIEARDRLRTGRDTSAWDFYEVACLELFVVERKSLFNSIKVDSSTHLAKNQS